jgi:hypothetical protein
MPLTIFTTLSPSLGLLLGKIDQFCIDDHIIADMRTPTTNIITMIVSSLFLLSLPHKHVIQSLGRGTQVLGLEH